MTLDFHRRRGIVRDRPLLPVVATVDVRDTFRAQRRPTGAPGVQPTPKRRVTLSLLGQDVDLVLKSKEFGDVTWVPQRGSEALTVREFVGSSWRAYTSDGLTYTFTQPAAVSPLGLWLLDRIEGPAGAKVQLQYGIAMHQVLPTPEHPADPLPVPAYFGVSIDLTRVLYNFSASGSPTLTPPMA